MCSLLEILTSVFTFASKPHILSTSSLDKTVSLNCLMYRPRPEDKTFEGSSVLNVESPTKQTTVLICDSFISRYLDKTFLCLCVCLKGF